ncbi:MAG TPA: hypothetical protein VGF67_05710 [Ktedonobacteraceae bacterium]
MPGLEAAEATPAAEATEPEATLTAEPETAEPEATATSVAATATAVAAGDSNCNGSAATMRTPNLTEISNVDLFQVRVCQIDHIDQLLGELCIGGFHKPFPFCVKQLLSQRSLKNSLHHFLRLDIHKSLTRKA